MKVAWELSIWRGVARSAVTAVTFPASVGAPDEDPTLVLTGTYTGGTFSSSLESQDTRVFREKTIKDVNGIPIRLC